MEVTVYFTECEHFGDLDNYGADLRGAGATIVRGEVNPEEETGFLVVNLPSDLKQFAEKWRATASAGFADDNFLARLDKAV